jgi:hypothetical protein
VVLNKDTVRAALFPPPVLDYSAEQGDISMEAIYAAATSILKASPRRAVILDGRTFLRAKQLDDRLRLAAAVGESAPEMSRGSLAAELSELEFCRREPEFKPSLDTRIGTVPRKFQEPIFKICMWIASGIQAV